MHEILLNIHMHTRYSDGTGSHQEIAAAAARSGLDAVIVTDHNVLVRGAEGYVRTGAGRVLLLVGEEIHDQARNPQKNHLLVLGAEQELAILADDPLALVKAVNQVGGVSFIAHPTDPAAPAFGEGDISWVDWTVRGFTGIELWNGLSELKTVLHSRLHGVLYAFFPDLVAHGPIAATIRRWDQLLAETRVVAVCGSDAHALHLRMGPLRRVIYPYEFHFRALNMHAFVPQPLGGDAEADKRSIYQALAAGHCFIGYDRLAATRGFRFTAHGREGDALMGDEINLHSGVTLQAYLPSFAELRLVRNGAVAQAERAAYALTYLATEPGVYRIEAYRRFLGRRRAWIFSNPIYIR